MLPYEHNELHSTAGHLTTTLTFFSKNFLGTKEGKRIGQTKDHVRKE
jgi:hypothetical protein